jgi:gamma-glutamyltranspeptidase/glutathione hydrolase
MERCAIAAPEPQATRAGERAFAAGGNALDAALAAAAALTVTFPHNCALGGDLFALVRDPDGRTISINGSGPAPHTADPDALRRRGPAMPAQGPDTVTVPGLVAGWERLHAAGAARPWAEALRAAIGLAADGAVVSVSLAGAIAENRTGIDADPGLRDVFAPGGTPLRAGDRLRQPALADSLRELASGGARALYHGVLGERLAAGLHRLGCGLDAADLRGFAAEAWPPLRGHFRGLDVLTSPPNSQGVLLLQALAALDAAGPGLDPLGPDAGRLAAVLHRGGLQRDAALADPRARAFDRSAWLGPDRLVELLDGGGPPAMEPAPRPAGDTIAIVAVDGDGRAVSLIQSVYWAFGALLLEPDTGIIVHNRGALFSLEPGHPNELAPGKRPAHTLMPVMVEEAGALRYVLGAMGGRAQPQIHAQILLRLLAGAPAQEAVSAPRWVVESDRSALVEDGAGDEVLASLRAAGLRPVGHPRMSDEFGHAQAIAVSPGRPPDVGSDPRAGTADP